MPARTSSQKWLRSRHHATRPTRPEQPDRFPDRPSHHGGKDDSAIRASAACRLASGRKGSMRIRPGRCLIQPAELAQRVGEPIDVKKRGVRSAGRRSRAGEQRSRAGSCCGTCERPVPPEVDPEQRKPITVNSEFQYVHRQRFRGRGEDCVQPLQRQLAEAGEALLDVDDAPAIGQRRASDRGREARATCRQRGSRTRSATIAEIGVTTRKKAPSGCNGGSHD